MLFNLFFSIGLTWPHNPGRVFCIIFLFNFLTSSFNIGCLEIELYIFFSFVKCSFCIGYYNHSFFLFGPFTIVIFLYIIK
jgi:hypothetical protein